MTTVTRDADALIDAARALAPLIFAGRDAIERDRCLPDDILEALRDAGLLRLQTPREFGGCELDYTSYMRVVEEVAKADGSAGWNVAILNGGLVCGAVPDRTARAIFGAGPDVCIPGSFNERNGRAQPVQGGYHVSGRWTFVSGCRHADWLQFACTIVDGDAPRLDTNGRMVVRRVLVPRVSVEIVDTWHVGGLRGTGSNDVVVADVFVPEDFTIALPIRPTRTDPLWSFPPYSTLGLGFVAVTLGIARTAIETVKDLAGAKRPHRATGLLRERAMVQVDIARAEVLLEAARAYLYGQLSAVWQSTERGDTVGIEQRAMLRAAVVHAAESAARVVDLMYTAAGGSSIYENCPLERCFRDVHTATQQIMLQPQHWESVGRVLLGLEPGPVPL